MHFLGYAFDVITNHAEGVGILDLAPIKETLNSIEWVEIRQTGDDIYVFAQHDIDDDESPYPVEYFCCWVRNVISISSMQATGRRVTQHAGSKAYLSKKHKPF